MLSSDCGIGPAWPGTPKMAGMMSRVMAGAASWAMRLYIFIAVTAWA